jgi:hypothetical protein
MVLAAIMAINFVIVNLVETKTLIAKIQEAIKANPSGIFHCLPLFALIPSPMMVFVFSWYTAGAEYFM